MPSKEELGERIKRFRLDRNLTLKEVELKAKVSATHVSEIERGMTSPTIGALTKIARAMGTEPSYFLESDPYPPVSLYSLSGCRCSAAMSSASPSKGLVVPTLSRDGPCTPSAATRFEAV